MNEEIKHELTLDCATNNGDRLCAEALGNYAIDIATFTGCGDKGEIILKPDQARALGAWLILQADRMEGMSNAEVS